MIRVAEPRWRNAASALDLMDGWSDRAVGVWFRLLMHASLYGQDVLDGQAFATATGLQAGRAMRTLEELSIHRAVTLHRASVHEQPEVRVWAWDGSTWVSPTTGAPQPSRRMAATPPKTSADLVKERMERRDAREARAAAKAKLVPKNAVDGKAALDSLRPFTNAERVRVHSYRKGGMNDGEVAVRIAAARGKETAEATKATRDAYTNRKVRGFQAMKKTNASNYTLTPSNDDIDSLESSESWGGRAPNVSPNGPCTQAPNVSFTRNVSGAVRQTEENSSTPEHLTLANGACETLAPQATFRLTPSAKASGSQVAEIIQTAEADSTYVRAHARALFSSSLSVAANSGDTVTPGVGDTDTRTAAEAGAVGAISTRDDGGAGLVVVDERTNDLLSEKTPPPQGAAAQIHDAEEEAASQDAFGVFRFVCKNRADIEDVHEAGESPVPDHAWIRTPEAQRKRSLCKSSPMFVDAGYVWGQALAALGESAAGFGYRRIDDVAELLFWCGGRSTKAKDILAGLADIIAAYHRLTPRDQFHPLTPSAIHSWASRGMKDEVAMAEQARFDRMSSGEKREYLRATWSDPVANAFHAQALADQAALEAAVANGTYK